VIVAEPTTALDPSVRAALQKLADIAVPPPVSLVPQTWGWAALAVIIVALVAWGLVRWHRHRKANRYRREALAELAQIERDIDANAGEALAEIPPLLKRVALAAWPRSRVASLTQTNWVDFLQATEAEARLPAPLAKLLDDIEYRSPAARAAIAADDARACARVAKHWIEAHRVSA
jgi:hypothetical protein